MDFSKFKLTKLNNQIYSAKGKKVQSIMITHKDNKPIKRSTLEKLSEEMKKQFIKKYKNGGIGITIQYPDKFYSGKVRDFDEALNFFTMDDYDNFDKDPGEYYSFIVDFVPNNDSKGGRDNNNDCLIKCIKKVIQTKKNEIIAEELKEYLKLNRYDKIDIKFMPKVEKYIKYKTNKDYAIYVSGDYSYISTIDTTRKINLILSNEHYSVQEDEATKAKYFSHKDRKLVVYEMNNNILNCFDGEDYFDMTEEEQKEIISKPRSSKYILVSTSFIKKTLVKNGKDLLIDECFSHYNDLANDLKKYNDTYFNLYRSDLKHTALNYFFSKVQNIHPTQIKNHEVNFLEGATYSAITYWEKYNGQVDSYDVNSFYPYVMSINNHYFPIDDGKYLIIDEIKDKPDYGIYRCFITKKDDKSYKFFKFNNKHYYTSIDIEVAIKYGLTVQLIQDGKPNFLHYTTVENGHHLFFNYMDEFYKIKQHNKGAKILLNILWGALCETNHYNYHCNSNTLIDISEAKITDIRHNNGFKIKCVYYNQNYYKTNWARIKPFVLAYGRAKLFYRYQKYEDDIVRINTDGFYTKNKLNIETSNKMGLLKYEGTKQINLTGLNTGIKI